MKELVLGGVRSGKSGYAQQRAGASGKQVVFIATATADDEGMTARITRHRQQRPQQWKTIEEPLALSKALESEATGQSCIIVDCLTLWLTNLLLHNDPSRHEREVRFLLATLDELTDEIILVSNEVGMGVVPMAELSRRFCDEAGRLHQQLAQQCERVTSMVAGIPQRIKG